MTKKSEKERAWARLQCIHYDAIEKVRVLGRGKRGRLLVKTSDGRRHFVKRRDVVFEN